MKTHGTCEKRGRGKRRGVRAEVEATPGEMAMMGLGWGGKGTKLTPECVSVGGAVKARVTGWIGGG